MCRGPVWQRGVWPIAKGFKSKKKCAEACARTKNCMGFDLSDETDKHKFKCFLYGDRRLAPASGVPGECFTLRDRLDDLRNEDVDEDFFEDHKHDGKEVDFGEMTELPLMTSAKILVFFLHPCPHLEPSL